MSSMDTPLTTLHDFTWDLIGLPITHVWRGHGSAIFLKFGESTPSKLVRKDGSPGNPKGQFGLMIDADWRLEQDQSILCGSTSDDQSIDAQLLLLQGLLVKKADLLGRLPELSLRLTTNIYVVTFKSDDDSSQWALADRRNGPPTRWLDVNDGEARVKVDALVRTSLTAD